MVPSHLLWRSLLRETFCKKLKRVPPLCVTSSECRALFRVENLPLSVVPSLIFALPLSFSECDYSITAWFWCKSDIQWPKSSCRVLYVTSGRGNRKFGESACGLYALPLKKSASFEKGGTAFFFSKLHSATLKSTSQARNSTGFVAKIDCNNSRYLRRVFFMWPQVREIRNPVHQRVIPLWNCRWRRLRRQVWSEEVRVSRQKLHYSFTLYKPCSV